MVFSSIIFLIYFLPVVALLYHLAGRRYKNIVLLAASIIFYAWGAPKFIFVILGTTFVDFHLVKWMDKSTGGKRIRLLLCSLLINVGLLFYFKYSGFFVENLNNIFAVFGLEKISWFHTILPIGISFYTFETLTYVVDVYRRVHKPLHKFWDYQLYIIFFPKLIAGPIVRFADIADQIEDRSANDTVNLKLYGIIRFSIGLGKKILIANVIGEYADSIFARDYVHMGSITAWLGILAYTMQIYFDFSGYSDMAIGLGRFFGFRLFENFDNPYTSKSITEFWRRWHISLGSWMRNYLYIPLGGNQQGEKRTYINLWLVFLMSGLWHGASWNFIFWGAFHGFFLVSERLFLEKLLVRLPGLIRIGYTFFVVMIGWVFFRIEGFQLALDYIGKMFSFDLFYDLEHNSEYYTSLALAIFFAFFAVSQKGKEVMEGVFSENYSLKRFLVTTTCSFLILVVCTARLVGNGYNPFIYFRF